MPPVTDSPARSRTTSRKVHRWLGIGAAVFFLLVSITGVLLQIEQVFGGDEASKERLAAMVSPASLARPLAVDPAGIDRARLAVLARFGDRRISAIEWQIKGDAPHYIFHLDGPAPLRVDVNAAANAVVDSRPDGEDWLLKLHTGEIVGDGGKVLGLAWGIALVAMSITGLLVYLHMYRSRQKGSASRLTGWRRYFW
mgnify:CR=1 FL=1